MGKVINIQGCFECPYLKKDDHSGSWRFVEYWYFCEKLTTPHSIFWVATHNQDENVLKTTIHKDCPL